METVLDAVSVEAQRGHMLHLQFENGEGRLFDMSGILDKKPFTVLKDARLFAMASVENGTVVWPEESILHRRRCTTGQRSPEKMRQTVQPPGR